MKKHTTMKRLLNKRLQGSLTTYVFIMFGMTIMLYLFGFTNTFDAYQSTATLNATTGEGSISHANFQQENNPLIMALNAILSFANKNMAVVVGGIGGLILLGVFSFFTGINLSVFYTYIIPIGILAVFLNYFIFPINPTDETLRTMTIGNPAISIATILIIFFNLWFLAGIIEYIRGAQT